MVSMEDIVGPWKDYTGIRHIALRDFLNKDDY